MNETPGIVIVWGRSSCLCDVGSPGYVAAVCRTAEGDEVLWLIDVAWLSDVEAPRSPEHGDGDEPHERLGPLPASWRQRVASAVPFRCGRPTKKMQPCRIPVAQAGDRCLFHRDKASAP